MDIDSKLIAIRDEGYRILKARYDHAKAGSRVEHLNDGSLRVSICAAYDVGDSHGFGSPCFEMESRDDCVRKYLELEPEEGP